MGTLVEASLSLSGGEVEGLHPALALGLLLQQIHERAELPRVDEHDLWGKRYDKRSDHRACGGVD